MSATPSCWWAARHDPQAHRVSRGSAGRTHRFLSAFVTFADNTQTGAQAGGRGWDIHAHACAAPGKSVPAARRCGSSPKASACGTCARTWSVRPARRPRCPAARRRPRRRARRRPRPAPSGPARCGRASRAGRHTCSRHAAAGCYLFASDSAASITAAKISTQATYAHMTTCLVASAHSLAACVPHLACHA